MKKTTTPVCDHPSKGGELTTPVCDHPSEGGEFMHSDEVVKLASKISKKLNLSFLSKKNTACNVCFAASQELRNEFKTTFTENDLVNFCLAFINSKNYRHKTNSISRLDFNKIPCPKDADLFWELVDLGEKIRQIQLNENPLGAPISLNIEINKTKLE